MPSGPIRKTRKSLSGLYLDLVWGAWAELGVSGWPQTHRNWAIDPEPLIIATSNLEDEDPRLRDEATDWCIRYSRLVSKVRLRNLLREQPAEVAESFGEFAATVNFWAKTTWPGATIERRYTPTGRSKLPELDSPALLSLRMKGIFGIGARTQILLALLSVPYSCLSVARLADMTGYTKRNVAEECESLQSAGVLNVTQLSNRFYYSLRRRGELAALVDPLPEVFPDWDAVFQVAGALVDLEKEARTVDASVIDVHARKTLDSIPAAIQRLQIDGPQSDERGRVPWTRLSSWAEDVLGDWAEGRWPACEEVPRVRHIRRSETSVLSG